MGQRYYDPIAKWFLTPDSYFLENCDKILESSVEGSLYSYAINNPICIGDPQGTIGGAPETLSSSVIEHGYGGDVKAAYKDRGAQYNKVAGFAAKEVATSIANGGAFGVAGKIVGGAVRQVKNYRIVKSGQNSSLSFHPKVRARALKDPKAHNFPHPFDKHIIKSKPTFQSDGSLLFRKSGSMNGKSGNFEMAVNPKKMAIFHRHFKPNR